jgi:hypothetical protein
MEIFLGERDGFAGVVGMNNFYFYRPANSLRHTIITWDKDQSFIYNDQTIFQGFQENEILRRAASIPELKAFYVQTMDDYANAALADNWFAKEVERIIALITPSVYEDPKKLAGNDKYDELVGWIREFATFRPNFVKAEVAANR